LSDGAGVISGRYHYDAYGCGLDNISSSAAETAVTRLLYSGEEFDSNLHHYFLRARYYDQGSGRFDAMDSFEGYDFDPLTLHKYSYAAGDPENGSDPSGTMTLAEVISVATDIIVI
jgi:RHS repeat-associated protein